LSERLLPANHDDHSVSSSTQHSDVEVGHGDYVTMAHQKPQTRTFSSRTKLIIGTTIAVVAVVAIVCGVMFTRQTTVTNDAVSSSTGSSNSAAGSGVLDDTIPKIGDSSSQQQVQDKQSSSSDTKMIRFDSDDNEYSGDYDSDYDTDYGCEYGDSMNMPQTDAVHHDSDGISNNNDMEYSGSYDSDYDNMGGNSDHESVVDYMSSSNNHESNDDWMNQQHQHVKKQHHEQNHHHRKVHECVVSQDGQDLIVRGIDRQSQCVVRSDTQEVGVKFDDEAIFPGAANDMGSINIGV